MEKSLCRRVTAALLAVFVFMSMMYISVGTVNAEEGEWSLWLPESEFVGRIGWVLAGVHGEETETDIEAEEIISAVSSDPDVISIKKEKWTDTEGVEHLDFMMIYNKPGEAEITAEIKKPDGSTQTLSGKMVIKKYPKMIKSLKVNGKKINTSKNMYSYDISKTKKTSVNIRMALNKGWKITYVSADAYTKKGTNKELKVNKKMITKGKAIKFPKKYKELYIHVGMEKGDDYIDYSFSFVR